MLWIGQEVWPDAGQISPGPKIGNLDSSLSGKKVVLTQQISQEFWELYSSLYNVPVQSSSQIQLE